MHSTVLTAQERDAVAEAMRCALELHKRGILDQAEGLYAGVLRLAPDHVEALHFLGVLKNQQGAVEEALALTAAALELNSGWVDLLVNHALILNGAGRHDAALGSAERAIAIDPAKPDAVFQRGNALMGLDRPVEALAAFEGTLALNPRDVDAMVNRGNALFKLKRVAEAVEAFAGAAAAAPGHAGILNNYGQALDEAGRWTEALACFDSALASDPAYVPSMINRAKTLLSLDRSAEALAGIDRTLELAPDKVTALNVRGRALAALGRTEEALAVFEAVIALAPDWPHGYNNRGSAQAALNRFAAARASFAIATEIDPTLASAHTNEAIVHLVEGDFARGWRKYEWRWQKPRQFAAPLWLGGEPLAGKTLLIYPEQGLGDTLQCIRYAALAAARGARVVAEVQLPLKPVMAGINGVGEVVAEGEPLPPHDLRCPMLSLPLAFGTTLVTIPNRVPYISAAPERIAKWRALMPETGKTRVGLVWAGSRGHHNNRNRSLSLERLLPLLAVPGIDWTSLQTEIGGRDRAVLDARADITNLGDALSDFGDTAAVMASLDLVVSVDTAAVHLAGAMAKPVWVLLPFSPDWRWLIDRRDSSWYPTARLFRQPAPGDWASVISEVVRELPGAVARLPSPSPACGGG
jgi:tetratricopeptide (TPR) repeat protein